MEREIREAFDRVRADPGLRERTAASVAAAVRTAALRRRRRRAFRLAAACAVLILAGLGGYRLYFTPTSVISVDINPSLELGVNRFDRVISVTGYNDDGAAVAESLDVLFTDYRGAVDALLQSQAVTECLAREEELSITVVQTDADQGEEILRYVARCTAREENAHCCGVAREEVSQAHTLGMSYGKYMAYLAVRALDDTVTPEQIQAMTMREIRELLTALGGDGTALPDQSAGPGAHGGGAHGHGSGRGAP